MGPRFFFFLFRAHIIFPHSSDTVLIFGGLPLAFEVLLFPFSKSTQHNFYLHGCHGPVISVFFNLVYFLGFLGFVLSSALLPSHAPPQSASLQHLYCITFINPALFPLCSQAYQLLLSCVQCTHYPHLRSSPISPPVPHALVS